MSQPITQEQALAQSFVPEEALSLAPIQPPVVKAKRKATHKHRRRFIGAITVRDFNGEKYRVANSAEAAQAQRQLLASKVSTVFENNLDYIVKLGIPLDAKSVADLAKAANTISEMLSAAHKGEPDPAPTTGMSQVGQLASQMMQGAMAGAMQGAQMTMEERLARISQLGKRQEKAIDKAAERMTKHATKTEVVLEPEQP